VAEIASMLAHPDCRALTILGPGGMENAAGAASSGNHRRPVLDGVYLSWRRRVCASTGYQPGRALGFPFTALEDPRLNSRLPAGRNVRCSTTSSMQVGGSVTEIQMRRVKPRLPAGAPEPVVEWTFEQGPCRRQARQTGGQPGRVQRRPVVSARARRVRRHPVPAEVPAGAHLPRWACLASSCAWVRVTTGQEIAAEIERDLDLHTYVRRACAAKQMRPCSIPWRLLSRSAEAFCNLSVFRGGSPGCLASGGFPAGCDAVINPVRVIRPAVR
jgi:hypothetical protein